MFQKSSSKLILLYSISIVLLVLSGCKQSIKQECPGFETAINEVQAHHYDIPVLVNSMPINCYSNQECQSPVLAYQSDSDYNKVVDFYKTEMESYGWQQLYEVIGQETVLSFEKPHKYATISIRPQHEMVDIYAFIAQKKLDIEALDIETIAA